MVSDQMPQSDTSGVAGEGRATRRSRRMLIAGVAALVAIGGLVIVGTQVTGSRSGTVVPAAVCQQTGKTTWTIPSAEVKYVRITWTTSGGESMSRAWPTVAAITYPGRVEITTPTARDSFDGGGYASAQVRYGPSSTSLTTLPAVACT